MNHIIAPSILSADFGRLNEEVKMLNESAAGWIHVDVMDGVFVPNISLGLPVIKAISKVSQKPLDVHLMIVHPGQYIQTFRDAGAAILTVQYEACIHLHRTIENIHKAGMKAGVALNPHTLVNFLQDIIADLDLVLIMSVDPGFGGQAFIENSYKKIREAKFLIESSRSPALIEVDGGIHFDNAGRVLQAGAQILVAGNTVFSDKNPKEAIQRLAAIKTIYEV